MAGIKFCRLSVILTTLIGLILVTGTLSEERVRFDNHKLYKVNVNTEDQYKVLKAIEQWESVNFWSEIHHLGDDCDIMVAPEADIDFQNKLNKNGIDFELTHLNIQKIIDEQILKARTSNGLEWTNYHTLDEIEDWLDSIAERFPNQVTPFSIGKTFENRTIKGLKISYKNGNKAVFIESNIHAREWITSASITWIIDQLLMSRHPMVRLIAENLDWHIIPVLNADGFAYSHEKNRMWRKSRQGHGNECVGVDMNRNFDYRWMETGASTDSCSETYAGPYAQSEPEIQQLVDYVSSLPDDYVKIYISLHSYGQYVLSPWGHTDTEFPENYDDMMFVAKGFSDGLFRRHETVFTYGSSSTTLYKVSGSGKEWAYAVKNIPIPYTIELRDKGHYGFILPPEMILPVAREVLDGFIGMIGAAKEIGVIPNNF